MPTYQLSPKQPYIYFLSTLECDELVQLAHTEEAKNNQGSERNREQDAFFEARGEIKRAEPRDGSPAFAMVTCGIWEHWSCHPTGNNVEVKTIVGTVMGRSRLRHVSQFGLGARRLGAGRSTMYGIKLIYCK